MERKLKNVGYQKFKSTRARGIHRSQMATFIVTGSDISSALHIMTGGGLLPNTVHFNLITIGNCFQVNL